MNEGHQATRGQSPPKEEGEYRALGGPDREGSCDSTTARSSAGNRPQLEHAALTAQGRGRSPKGWDQEKKQPTRRSWDDRPTRVTTSRTTPGNEACEREAATGPPTSQVEVMRPTGQLEEQEVILQTLMNEIGGLEGADMEGLVGQMLDQQI